MEDAKKLLKKFAKKVLKKVITSKVALIFLPLLIILVILLSLFIYGITLDEGTYKEDDWSNTPFAASSYINAIDISENGLVLEYSAQELWDKMLENGSNIKNYLNSPEELEKLMNVEIVTQYPKIGKGNIDGIVEFKRVDTNSNIKDLKYVDEETFNSYIEKYNSSGDETASNYFTIDSSGNLLMSQWTKITTKVTTTQGEDSTTTTTVGYSMTATNINYKAVLQKYTMPFNYLWALLISTGGHDFVLDLADYVLEDSEIEIAGTENYTTSTDTQVETTEIEVQVTVEKEDPNTGEKIKETKTETQTKTTTTETTVETNNVAVELTKANTWIVDYEKDSNGKEKTTIKDDPKSTEQNFITILNKYPSTKKNMIAYAQWIFELLGKNTDTANMVDLTKYLLYKATGKDFGVTEYDFSEYANVSFVDYSSYYGDYVVKTNDTASAPVVEDKAELEKGLKKWLKTSSSMKSNALSVLDTVFECQEKYHVNAVFTYAFLRTETRIGTADTNYVNNDNNWGSWALGNKYSSPSDNIITITSKMESGNKYFTQGNITESKIGAIYCPNMPEHPNQGDEWIKTVITYMNELYSSMGMASIASGGEGTIGVYTSLTSKTYNLYLQGSGAPWANEDYGNSHSMAMAGCGPTAAAIIASSYNGQINPSTVRQAIVSKYGLGNHSSPSIMKDILGQMLPNVKLEVANFDENKIKQCLQNSGQVWLVVQNCKYTSDAHCIALIDYKEPGMVYVAHGTAKTRPYGWDTISYLKTYNKYDQILYIGGK